MLPLNFYLKRYSFGKDKNDPCDFSDIKSILKEIFFYAMIFTCYKKAKEIVTNSYSQNHTSRTGENIFIQRIIF